MKDIVEEYKGLTDHPEGLEIVLDLLNRSLTSDFPVVEVGTYRGGSAMCFLNVISRNKRQNWLYTIDPYGSLPYHDGHREIVDSIYDDETSEKCIRSRCLRQRY